MPEIVGRLRTPRLAGAPSAPAMGEVYYDTTSNILYWWNGTTWISASGGASGATDLRYNGNWAAGSYTDGDIVVYNGVSYMAVRPTSVAPTPWISPAGGSDLRYDGAYTPANYTDGDIIIGSDGISYMCVKPTSAAPVPWASTQYPPKPTYGTTLPASPVDGQEAILVDSVTAPTYTWRFRYNAQSTARDKWEFVGGAEWIVTVETTDTATWAGYADLPNGPLLTIPRTGIYNVRLGATVTHSVAGGTCYLAITGSAIDSYAAVAAANYNTTMGRAGVWNVPAGIVARLQVAVTAGTGTYGKRHLSVIPVKVS